MSSRHTPILTLKIAELLAEPFRKLEEPAYLVDCTFGGGGHTSAFLDTFKLIAKDTGVQHRVIGVDQDLRAIDRAKERFAEEISAGSLELRHQRFSELKGRLGDVPVYGMLADLGFSSDQMDDPTRGLSFKNDGPLDMRLNPNAGESCHELLGRVSERDLADILFKYGEERFSRQIARAIVRYRDENGAPETTGQLVAIIERAVPGKYRHGRIHFATRSFQALRILVNEELEELEGLLNHVILQVKPGGRVGILSFHSLEDRLVKQAFRQKSEELKILTKKPLLPDDEETAQNPRARSAKLRVAERI
ncbi:16S rRNA (cytosine(1402)-N(4))-methyltransferase RsmH [bacterium]|nr:16S rRNA (cytosine(1402)-N(4))-methyltransferase RsmH [bacterium]